MTIWSALYKLLIGPLELLFEFIFSVANRVVPHPGYAIIFLSLAVNFLVLPMYKRADALQKEERDLEERLRPMADHIKKTFHGDERFMMLQTYYRQNDYRPTYALKGSLSLLLQIPFFIAAYNFLSGLQMLQGVSFGPIRDLGAPDAMFSVGGFAVNMLPVLMTAINAVSAAVYMKGFPLKSKIQTYGLALVFLVFLYSSPAGLVFYWTLNNVFSLGKNIFYKFRDPKKVLAVCASVVSLLLLIYFIFIRPYDSRRKEFIVLAALLLLQIPMAVQLLKRKSIALPELTAGRGDDALFLLGSIFLTVLTGILIPSAVIESSPAEFVDYLAYKTPLWYVLSSLLMAIGTFIIWFRIFYRLASASGKKLMSLAMLLLSGAAAVDYMFFGTKYGDISSQLVYDTKPESTAGEYLLNVAAIVAAAALLYLLWKKKNRIMNSIVAAMCLAVTAMSCVNIVNIQRYLSQERSVFEEASMETASFTLSKTGKNVIVFMIDRAIGYYVPYIFEEKPELQEQFSGFTFYPNALSYAASTNVGTAPLFGGYDYMPVTVNSRADEPLVDKQNEALKVMPVLFDEAGYEVTVCDPPYAGYSSSPPDLSIYDDYPDIHRYVTMGQFAVQELQEASDAMRYRNFFCFSIYKISPLFLQPTLYTDGHYNDVDVLSGKKIELLPTQTVDEDMLHAAGVSSAFQRSYAVLERLTEFTEITDEDIDTFLMMDNETTHEPTLLQMPDYIPSASVDNTAYESIPILRNAPDGSALEIETSRQLTFYHADMATFLQLGQWMDYLKENDVYDNTRIIIVADHGARQNYSEHKITSDWFADVLAFNPVLLVKDFGSTEGFTTDDQFMTNADVPTIAMADLIEDPVNPFTGNPIDTDLKNGRREVMYVFEVNVGVNNGNTFLPGAWFANDGDDIFDLSNWEYLGEY